MWNIDTLIEILAAFAGTVGYGALFNVRGKKLLFAGLGGMCGWIIYLLLNTVIANEIICCLIVAVITSAYSEILARVLKTPATTFYIATLMPLIPGSALYYSINAAVGGDLQGFIHHISRTVEFAAALSVGIIVANTVARNIKPKKIKK
jgi:uncharacterized membrane protein YjjB (DUF3815 family)